MRNSMLRLSRCLLLSLCALIVGSTVDADQDHFYEQQLQTAKSDFQANRIPQAADELRIAAFGFLDKPPLLSEALVRLAVAQSALGRDTTRTIERFMEVEQRFAPYASLQIESPVKLKFEELLLRSVPRATLAGMPGLSRIANYEIDKLADLPAEKRIAAYQAGMRREPNNPQWSMALAHAYVERRDCRAALPIVNKLGAAELHQRLELYADQVVCFADAGRFADAQAAFVKLPDALKSRPDVVNA